MTPRPTTPRSPTIPGCCGSTASASSSRRRAGHRPPGDARAGVGRRAAGVCVDIDPDLAADIAARGRRHRPRPATPSTARDVERLFADAVAKLGGIDGVVDIVGMARYAHIIEIDRRRLELALRHRAAPRVPRHAARGGARWKRAAAAPWCSSRRCRASPSAPRHAAYGAAKAGLMSLVRTGAVELGPHGIRVNAVAPGVVWTPRVSAVPRRRGPRSATSPTRRCAASRNRPTSPPRSCSSRPTSRATSPGQTLIVDGGVGAKFPYPMADL